VSTTSVTARAAALGAAGQPLLPGLSGVAPFATLLVGGALLVAARAPLWLLLAGPLLLGVPHVASDLRTLVLRPGLHRRGALLLAAGVPLLFCCVRPTLWAGLLAAGGALLAARASWRRRALLGAGCALLLAGALWAGRSGDLVFAHLHNLVALGFAAALWPGGRKALVWPAAAVAAGALALLFVPLEVLAPASLVDAGLAPGGLRLDALRAGLAPGLGVEAGTRLVLLYGFLQAAHYAAWLVVIPAATTCGGAGPGAAGKPAAGARGVLRELLLDLGAPLVCLCGLLALGLAGWALFDAAGARDGYLRFAGFHGHLELAALALWAAEGRGRTGA
jgi:hypothetical protein